MIGEIRLRTRGLIPGSEKSAASMTRSRSVCSAENLSTRSVSGRVASSPFSKKTLTRGSRS